jgi:TPR repeat protein
MMQAQTGDVAALTNIGDLYYYGARGMPRDLGASYDHYNRAAEAGNSGALAKVGSMYQKGEGVPQNYSKAVEAFNASAQLNDEKGHNGLAYMYFCETSDLQYDCRCLGIQETFDLRGCL